MSQSAINLDLHQKQGEALNTPATEILYGGSAGGGKSHLMRAAAILWCSAVPGLQVYLFRRIREDLVKNHMDGPKGFRSLLAPWVLSGFVQIVDDELRFWNGSKIYLCHCKDEKDRYKYQGAEIHVLMIDELTHFTEIIYRFLRGRVRAVGIFPPKEYQGRFPKILCGSNPGGVGHSWVKQAFVDMCRDGDIHAMPDDEGGMLRQYIPARLDDNPSMTQDDPLYRQRLRGLGNDALVKAMEDGDWDIVEGAFFDKWSSRNIIEPFKVPAHWLRFTSFDWGSAAPFSYGWWAVASEDYIHKGKMLPRGAMIRYREWYGCKKDKNGMSVPNVGLKLTAEKVASGVIAMQEPSEKIDYSVADPAIFSENGGPSINERMDVIGFEKADNKRVTERGQMGGWDQMRQRIEGENDVPMIYCFSTCYDSIRTIPVIQHDPRRAEDLDTNAEDHAADEWRYACMSRPWIKAVDSSPKKNDRWDKAFNREDEDSWRIV